MVLKLAWRNVWRNRRRTLITASSIAFAVLFSSFFDALEKGSWDNMIDNVVNFHYGFVQIHSKGYWKDRTINRAFSVDEKLAKLEKDVPEIKAIVPRIESFALVALGEQTVGVMVIGTDPASENRLTNLEGRLSSGTYFSADDKSVVIAEGVAKKLDLNLGDTLVFLSEGYHGANAAGKYPIKGIVSFGSPELNKRMVYLPLKEAQWFFGAEDLVTSIALKLDKKEDIPEAVEAVANHISLEEFEVMDWKEMMPDLVQAMEMDVSGNYIIYFILYIIISFGIFGTILMMMNERKFELGIMVAIGMRKLQLAISIWMEVILMSLFGVAGGILLAAPVTFYFHTHPIRIESMAATFEQWGFEPVMPASYDWQIFYNQAIIVFVLALFLSVYPVRKILKIDALKAMRP